MNSFKKTFLGIALFFAFVVSIAWYKYYTHDIFYSDGYQGQYTIIIPSLDMVIVRLGLEDIDMNQLIKTIINAIKK